MVQSQLLFFDTFSHETGQAVGSLADINLDLVQFPSPVHITEVRVIPLGAKVKANFPGGHRMGATNPSKFDLDLFVNNLKAPGASTFETVGQLHYNQAGVISLVCRPEIATDGLVLRGLYSTITLAVYGVLSDQTPEQLARQGAQEAAVKVKQEVAPGPLPQQKQEPRSLGEAYAAEWTEQHKNHALKAEPPDDIKQWAGNDVKDTNGGAANKVKREKNGDELSPRSDRSFNRNRRSPSRDRSYERMSRDRSLDRRSRDRDNRSRDRDYRSRSRDRKFRDRSPNSYRKQSPGSVSRRSYSPYNRSLRSLSPRGRSPARDRSPKRRSPRDRDRSSRDRDSQYSGDRSYRSLSRDRSRAGDKRKYQSSSSLNRDSPERRSKSPGRRRQLSGDRTVRSSSRRRDSLSPRIKDRSRSGSGARQSSPGIRNGHSSPVNDAADQKDLFDAVSDISDGDIPGEPDDDMDDEVNDKEEELANTLSSSIVKEDVEEISDEEAEWSDDFDAGCYSDMENIEMDDDWEDPIIYFNPTNVNLAPLKCLQDPSLPLSNKDSTDKTVEQIMETNFEDNCDEKFIESIEHLSKVVQSEVPRTKKTDIHEKLVNISMKSINFDLAMSHSKPLLKVRHLKSGLKLMIELLQCGELMVNILVQSKVQEELLGLLARDHMAMSLKLLILKALDLSLNSLDGFHHFRSSHLYSELSSLKPQTSRIMVAVSSLLEKLRLLEQLEQLIPLLTDNVEERMEDVTDIINEIREAFRQDGEEGSSYWRAMDMFSVLDSLLWVLTGPATSDSEQLVASVQGVLSVWVGDTRGLLHLAHHPDTTTNIIRALLGYRQEEETNNGIAEDTEGLTRGYQLGCQLAYMTQCLQYLDTIRHHVSLAQGDRLLMETDQVYSAVSSLYSLTFSSQGREAVTRTVTMGSNVDCLLSLTQHSQQSGKKDMKKSAARGFASELLLLVVRGSDNAEWLRQYADQLMSIGSSDSHSKLSELVSWVSPAQQDRAVFTQTGLDSLISLVKGRLDSGEPELDRILSCELVTAVRLLHWHVTPRADTCPILGTGVSSRCCVSAAVITMFSSDLVTLYSQLLDKISQDHHQPHLHTATFLGSKGFTVISVLHPVISTLRVILESVIECCDTDYKDTSVVNVLLRINTLLSIVPSSSNYHSKAVETSQQLVKCLLAFTRPNVDLSKNNVGKTVWSAMVTQLLEYIVSSPAVLVPGLSLLSQLLPLPLPLPSTRPLSEAELSCVSTARKLWSAHLHPTQAQVSSLVSVMATHTHPTMVTIIHRLTDQLASLSPLIAGMLVTSLVSRAAVETEPANEKPVTEALTNHRPASESRDLSQPIRARLLSYLDWCVTTQPTINTVTCHTMDTDTVFSSDLVTLLRSGLSSASEQCQVSAVAIVTSLADPSISIAAEQDTGDTSGDQTLADSLPSRDSTLQLLSCLLDSMTLDTTAFSTLTQILATLTAMTKTQYLLSIVKTSLVTDSKTRPVHELLRRLAVQFNSENTSLVSCLTSLMSLVTSLQQCDYGGGLSLEEVGDVLGWLDRNASESEVAERRRTHPLVIIANRINSSEPDLALADISGKMSELVTKLESLPADVTVSYQDNVVSLGCEGRTPLELWTARKVVIESEDISSDQLSMSFWLQTSEVTNSDTCDSGAADQGSVPCDLLSVAGKYLPGLELLEAAKEVTKERSLGMVRKKKGSKKSYMETKALLNKNIISAFRDGKNVNLRGRGFARTAFKTDQFRTRPPNTSRPPSLHVDDFLLLEMAGHQPTGPTGYNKQSVKAAKELFAQRDAEAALKPPPVLREATREPVGLTRSRGRGDNRSSSRGGGDRSFRGSNGSNGRSFRRGWSPSNEPRDLGREARPRRPGGSGGRGAPRGGGRHRQ